jgi:hypothetical protein
VAATAYERSVFVNCPFDAGYQALFDALLFAIHDCGFVVRCAREVDDGAQVRIEKILAIIEACRYGIHDLSRAGVDANTGLARFNMPLELGLFLGARRFGRGVQQAKVALVLDVERFRFRDFCSDIAGQDPHAHGDDPKRAVRVVRDWLQGFTDERIPSGSKIYERDLRFRRALPVLCAQLNLDSTELSYLDYLTLVTEWQKGNPWG